MKFATIIAATAIAAASSVEAARDWSYMPVAFGLVSPTKWSQKYPACGGKSQSPIDISVPASTKVTAPLSFTGAGTSFTVSQPYDAYTVTAKGSAGASINGKAYTLNDVKLRFPSEHTINGNATTGELQFFHTADDGKTAVVSLFIRRNDFLQTPDFIKNFWTALKTVDGESSTTAKLGSAAALLTPSLANGRVFSYQGSLTTPACTENVDWWVLETPVYVNSADVKKLADYLPRVFAGPTGENARPVQPLNDRKITVY